MTSRPASLGSGRSEGWHLGQTLPQRDGELAWASNTSDDHLEDGTKLRNLRGTVETLVQGRAQAGNDRTPTPPTPCLL